VTQTLTFRPKDPTTLVRLEQRARRAQIPKTALADRYVEEGLAMDAYPGIVFRDGPDGRRPAVVGGPDVWQVIEVFIDEGRDIRATAKYLDLRPGLLEVAVAYYADHPPEVDEWIATNHRLLDEAEAAFRRRQAVEKA
jgi:hypothetical protein